LRLRGRRITIVQPAESRRGLNLAFGLSANCCRETCWRALRESKMSPVLVVQISNTTHIKTEFLELRYPWHPLHKQTIPVHFERRGMNATHRRSVVHPARILSAHLADQIPGLARNDKVELKQRNPDWGWPRIAQHITLAFHIPMSKDVVKVFVFSRVGRCGTANRDDGYRVADCTRGTITVCAVPCNSMQHQDGGRRGIESGPLNSS
jgi:hypothetical protein